MTWMMTERVEGDPLLNHPRRPSYLIFSPKDQVTNPVISLIGDQGPFFGPRESCFNLYVKKDHDLVWLRILSGVYGPTTSWLSGNPTFLLDRDFDKIVWTFLKPSGRRRVVVLWDHWKVQSIELFRFPPLGSEPPPRLNRHLETLMSFFDSVIWS